MAEAITVDHAPTTNLWKDVFALGKPRLSSLVVATAAMGYWAAPSPPPLSTALLFLLGTSGLVFAANAMNSLLETDVDALMKRTRSRPLPAGRIRQTTASVVSGVTAAASLGILLWSTNAKTFVAGLLALVTYVLFYTPMKRVTPMSLYVGAIPGAIPPLMGWVAATGKLDAGAWTLFGILFFWQVPHFLAISLFNRDDYERGGLRVMSVTHGSWSSRFQLFLGAVALLIVSLVPQRLDIAGDVYGMVAFGLGILFVLYGIKGLAKSVDDSWARRVFRYSILYLPLLAIALLAG